MKDKQKSANTFWNTVETAHNYLSQLWHNIKLETSVIHDFCAHSLPHSDLVTTDIKMDSLDNAADYIQPESW